MTGRIPSVGGSALLTADVVLPGRIRLTLATGRKRADAIVVGNGAYFKANAEFWRGQVPARLRSRIANRWIGLPGNALAGFASILSVTNPALAGRCTLLSHVGVLSSGGIATVGGRRVLVIVDRGRIPGATPSKIYIAASGPPLPMREIQTGPQVPGGTPNRTCGETKSDVHDKSSRQRLSIGHYNAPVTITAPANVLNVQPPSSTTQA